ncbi:MAG TPA: glycosyltransferase 87 family protein [Bryobacteraceae bacterium]|nr:glycosyltransferase 87 family protein [Bryobacteraceae bacterium]
MDKLKLVLPIVAVVLGAVVIEPPLMRGWHHVETDFPNLYTAAVLARKHLPLRDYYDWPWFQRQMNYAGIEHQLGGYSPQSPVTFLPALPFSGLRMQVAKRVWLLIGLLCLGMALVLLSRLGGLPVGGLAILAWLGYAAIHGNLILGQYYFFLLLLLSASVWYLLRGRAFSGGVLMGLVFALKLYGGPFLLYFAWKRQWRALGGMLAACAVLGMASIAMFGFADNLYYILHVIPRALDGQSQQPYAPGLPTISNMLRHAFVLEPELNPNPLADWPALCFFLQPLMINGALVFSLIWLPRDERSEARDLALFIIMLMLISPNRAAYTSVLLLVPVALLLRGVRWPAAVGLIAAYVLLGNNIVPSWSWLFPKVWLLLALFLGVSSLYWSRRYVLPAGAAVLVVASVSAWRHVAGYYGEPPQRFESVAVQPGAIYSSAPAPAGDAVLFESIAEGRYLIRRGAQRYAFDGNAFHPSAAGAGEAFYFELTAAEHSSIRRFDPASKLLETLSPAYTSPMLPSGSGAMVSYAADGKLAVYDGKDTRVLALAGPVRETSWFPDRMHVAAAVGDQICRVEIGSGSVEVLARGSEPAVSPDGEWLAFTRDTLATRQVWVQNLKTSAARQLTEGSCDSYLPAWDADSTTLVFASDCERAMGLPRLYRARIR